MIQTKVSMKPRTGARFRKPREVKMMRNVTKRHIEHARQEDQQRQANPDVPVKIREQFNKGNIHASILSVRIALHGQISVNSLTL